MSTPSEHDPTEPQPVVSSPGAVPPARTARARPPADGSLVDRAYRLAVVVIAAVLVIFLILVLAGYPIHMKIDKSKTGGRHGVQNSQPVAP